LFATAHLLKTGFYHAPADTRLAVQVRPAHIRRTAKPASYSLAVESPDRHWSLETKTEGSGARRLVWPRCRWAI